jgi:molecular chaperone GrpE
MADYLLRQISISFGLKRKEFMAKDEQKDQDSNVTGKEQKTQKKKSAPLRGKTGKKQDKAEEKLNEKIREMESQLDEAKDKYLRLYSEFDNYRKRTQKEKIELSKTASEDVVLPLLSVLDDFERALKAHEDEDNDDKVAKEGIQLIYNKFKSILEQKGLEPIQAAGEVFDVDYHDAMTNIPAPSEDMKGRVIEEIEKGYILNGKVIRYAKVVVGQ